MQVGNATVEVLADAEALAARAADWLVATIAALPGRVAVCLTGGETPRHAYRELAARRSALPLERLHWFWGDERFVPPDHPDSNYRMANGTLFSPLAAARESIHRIPTSGFDAEAAALAYERELQAWYGVDRLDSARHLFDIMLLGLGANGHLASLFPDQPLLAERRRWTGAVFGVAEQSRITLTYPVLESARETAFLVAGAQKREALAAVLGGDRAMPAARLEPRGGLRFFIDRAAAP